MAQTMMPTLISILIPPTVLMMLINPDRHCPLTSTKVSSIFKTISTACIMTV